MKIILASTNKHKLDEIKHIFKLLALNSKILTKLSFHTLDEVLTTKLDICESGFSFKENAVIKALASFKALNEKFCVLSDDSGLCVRKLNDGPGIYSARFSEISSFAKDLPKSNQDHLNRQILIKELEEKNLTSSQAYFACALALVYKGKIYTSCGYLHGFVKTTEEGLNGFGYDSLFVASTSKTLATLSFEEKNKISHRFKACENLSIILKMLLKDE